MRKEHLTDTRPITEDELKILEPFTKRHKASLWGEESETTPTVVHTVFGDSRSVITLDPTNDRPAYYVMLADSSINSFEDALEFIADNEKLVFQAIEEEYGNVDDTQYDEEGNEIDCYDDGWENGEDGEMPLNISSGYTTGYFDDQPFKEVETTSGEKNF
jgi:hypothetical protein